jgi:hypothetical protein
MEKSYRSLPPLYADFLEGDPDKDPFKINTNIYQKTKKRTLQKSPYQEKIHNLIYDGDKKLKSYLTDNEKYVLKSQILPFIPNLNDFFSKELTTREIRFLAYLFGFQRKEGLTRTKQDLINFINFQISEQSKKQQKPDTDPNPDPSSYLDFLNTDIDPVHLEYILNELLKAPPT